MVVDDTQRIMPDLFNNVVTLQCVCRIYRTGGKDAMGRSVQYRGFNDDNLYVAYNTRSKVTPTKVKSNQSETAH